VGLSLAQMGVLLGAFSRSYALAQLPAGGLVDKIRPRILLSGGLFRRVDRRGWSRRDVGDGLSLCGDQADSG